MKQEPSLGNLILRLEQELTKGDRALSFGFQKPHCYRGAYFDVAFVAAEDIRLSDMLRIAKAAVGKTYVARKGGEFRMTPWSRTWIVNSFDSFGETLGPILLEYILTGRPE